MEIKSLEISGGIDKGGNREHIQWFSVPCGSIISIVGPTGSGKSTLINDIEQLANEDTTSLRKILINGDVPSPSVRNNPKNRVIAQLSQNMHFLTDMSVEEFLILHAKSRNKSPDIVEQVVSLTNTFCGEPIDKSMLLTLLSGGQTRSLMIADIALISQSPIVLIDEIENAGIRKREAINELIRFGKIVIIVTHDPTLALMAQKRVVMRNGGMERILNTSESEKKKLEEFTRLDNDLCGWREKIRQGELIA
jgi:ABC-type lipoprotein export system ATPase subunit